TKFIIFAKRRTKHNFKLFWANAEIERVSSYVYLGVPFSETHNFLKAKEHFIRKTKVALAQTFKLIWKSKLKTLSTCLALFKSLVRSVLMYCAPVWGFKFVDLFETIQTGFLKRLFLLPKL